jgi:hypothetical protein
MAWNMSLSTAYKALWLGGVWWPWGISWWGPKERSEAWQENGLWKEEGNAGETFKDATGLDYWDNLSRIEFVCVWRWYNGRLTRSSWDSPGVLEREPSIISSSMVLGHILLWFAMQVFWVKIWATRLVSGKAKVAEGSHISWGAAAGGRGGEKDSTGSRRKEEAWDTQDLRTIQSQTWRGE